MGSLFITHDMKEFYELKTYYKLTHNTSMQHVRSQQILQEIKKRSIAKQMVKIGEGSSLEDV